MANNRQTTSNRSGVIRCENCGEDYSVTYKRCPFCDERPGRGSRPVSGRRGSRMSGGRGRGDRINPVQLVMLIASLILIVAAGFIVFKSVAPLLSREKGPSSAASSSAASSPAVSSAAASSSAGPDLSSGVVSAIDPPVEPVESDPPVESDLPAPAGPTGITLNRSDFTLTPGETFQLTAAVTPEGVAEPVVFSSSDTAVLTVDETGNVTNVYTGSDLHPVTVTAVCGEQKAECVVRCRGSAAAAPSSGSFVAYITGASSGLNIRSGPGTSYSIQASAANGVQVTVLEDAGGGWYKIRYTARDGSTGEGYVSKEYVSTTQ